MNHGAFQLNKVRRLIRTQGQVFYFKKPGKNEFGEPNGETVSQEIRGVFHELTEYKSKTTSEASTIRQKSSPMLLTLWESVGDLHHTDVLYSDGKKYRVNEIHNFMGSNLVADISLEEVQS